jgi:hypothetical protein
MTCSFTLVVRATIKRKFEFHWSRDYIRHQPLHVMIIPPRSLYSIMHLQ